jgi:DsbC/DsbD-like thiol-disulfide interchange protein
MLRTLLKIGCALTLLTSPLAAEEFAAQKGLKAVEFLDGWRTSSGTHMAAIRISLEDGWKTYWRAPGGNGIPPRFAWKGSKNVASVKIHWPSPKVYMQDGIRTIGYKGDFILPVEIKPAVSGQPIKLKSRIDYGICSDVCIPVTSRIETNLAVSEVAHQKTIKIALNARAHTGKSSGVKSVSCIIDPYEDGLMITANINFKNSAPKVQHAVIEFANPNVWVNQASFNTSGKSISAHAELVSYSSEVLFMDRSKLRLTLIGKSHAIEIVGCPAPS